MQHRRADSELFKRILSVTIIAVTREQHVAGGETAYQILLHGLDKRISNL